jgi:pyruvate dehydrogenase (quinone)
MSEYENLRTADSVAEALLDWKVDVIFGLPGDGINGFIEALSVLYVCIIRYVYP